MPKAKTGSKSKAKGKGSKRGNGAVTTKSSEPPAKRQKLNNNNNSNGITKQEFLAAAEKIGCVLSLNGEEYEAKPKTTSAGSVGWGVNRNVKLEINGQDVKCSLAVNVTAHNSKNWKEGEKVEAEDSNDDEDEEEQDSNETKSKTKSKSKKIKDDKDDDDEDDEDEEEEDDDV